MGKNDLKQIKTGIIDWQLETLYKEDKWEKLLEYLKKNFDLNYQLWRKTNILQRIMLFYPDLKEIKSLIPIDLEAPNGDTALTLAAVWNCYSSMKRLLHEGADPNHADHGGRTPIFYASDRFSIKLLMDYHADITKKDKDGISVCDFYIANKVGYLGAIQYCQEIGIIPADEVTTSPYVSKMKPVHDEVATASLQRIYDVYNLCNEICWNHLLPEKCVISFGMRRTAYSHMAEARMRIFRAFGTKINEICFNININEIGNSDTFVKTLLHESAHIWELSSGEFFNHRSIRTHSNFFWKKLKEIGLDEKLDLIRSDSLASLLAQKIHETYPRLNDDLQIILSRKQTLNKQYNAIAYWNGCAYLLPKQTEMELLDNA